MDSLNPPAGTPPAEGPGSKTPVNSPAAPGAPIGGGGAVKPLGEAGAPGKEKPMILDQLDEDSFSTLVVDVYKAMDDAKIRAKTINEILDYLLNNSWSEKRLLKLSKYLKTSIKNMIHSIKTHISEDGVNDTIDLIHKKITELQGEKGGPQGPMANPPGGPMPSFPGAPPAGLPPVGASDDSRQLTDVDLDTIEKRGLTSMGKVLVKDGAVIDSAQYAQEIINKLSSVIRKIKKSMKEYDDAKLKYASFLALKFAADDMTGGLGGPAAGPEGLPGMGGPEVGPAEATESASGDVKDAVDEIKNMVSEIKEDVEEIREETVGEKEEELGEEIGEAKDVIGEGEKAAEGIEDEDTSEKLTAKIQEARQVVAEAKKKLTGSRPKSYKEILSKIPKGKGKAAMEEKKENPFEKKEDKDEKKDDKDEKKEDKKEDKEDKKSSIDVESLIRKVRAKLEELRSEKEANLYPFKKEIKPIPPVDNINAETAAKTISTVNSEIKGQPVTDKDFETLNHGDIGQKDLAYKTEGKSTPEKKVSVEVAERIRQHSVQNAVDQARLSVELAARQQLKGMIDDPLREALRRNMAEAEIDPELAEAIIHNAYIDGYEESHKAVMKEAFDTFMTKDIDEFTKIAKFVDEYQVKTAAVSSVENTEEIFRDKEASTEDAPLRGFAADKDARKEAYKRYWQEQAKKRGYV